MLNWHRVTVYLISVFHCVVLLNSSPGNIGGVKITQARGSVSNSVKGWEEYSEIFTPLSVQTDIEITREEDFARILQMEEEYIQQICEDLMRVKPDLVITEKGISGNNT